MTEELLQDLAEYKTYKDKGVMMASRSLIALFRSLAPELLHKKDRGRPTEATTLAKMKQFGESDVVDFIAGAEVLDNEENDEDDEEQEDDDSGEEEDSDEEEGDEEGEGESTDNKKDVMTLEEKTQKAREATVGRILSDEDFRKIAAAQLRKQVEGVRKGGKKQTKKGVKRTASEANIDDDEWVNADDDEEATGREELVNLEAIEMIHKKKRHDKEARMASIIAGREGREKFGHISKKGPGASMTNKQKAKKKNFSMMKHKIKTKGKKSFREKQQALKKRLIKSQKFK